MDLHLIFLYLAILLFFARLTGDIFAKFGIPSVLGEIFVGVLLGQSVLGIIPLNDVMRLLAELGIILLLFHIGLEADLKQLKEVGFSAAAVAITGALAPMVAGFLVSYYVFNFPVITSLFIGGTLTATSIGITVRVLEDLGKMRERFAQIVLGAAVLDDIFGVVVLAALFEFSKTQEINVNATLLLILYIGTFFLFAPIIGKFFAYFISTLSRRLNTLDFVPPVVVAIILLFAFAAHEIGSPEILGAFTAGIAFSRRFTIPFAAAFQADRQIIHKIEESLNPLIWLFTPIFFVYVGLQLNLKAIDFSSLNFWLLSAVLFLVALTTKLLAGLFIKGTKKEKLSVGFSMLPRGEVGLIFAEFGRISGVYDSTLYAVIIFVVALTTLLSPIVLKTLLKEKGGDSYG
ncbi:Kef-type K+ transport system, membrane component KefB [Thermodesulfovibrio aggregans]|uniref:Kef-type K+ transport system, membrane component KefB n=1 Tax=Thermodesulfovibrio aggregans TaxID=86166 RepID=A0A0U9HQ70_9BACT|nr:cation:proton antiporter [Thermodesulfovibrio aggregans]GAQ95168.1 Kef-type K+ transport system, membrane component KefB [Thermodesulfovibrio aggregans]